MPSASLLFNGRVAVLVGATVGDESNDVPTVRQILRESPPMGMVVDFWTEQFLKTQRLVWNLDSDEVP